MGDYKLNSACGWDLTANVSNLAYTEFSDQQSAYYVVLPGLPPSGNCHAQSCPGLDPCKNSAGCYASDSASASFMSPSGLEQPMASRITAKKREDKHQDHSVQIHRRRATQQG